MCAPPVVVLATLLPLASAASTASAHAQRMAVTTRDSSGIQVVELDRGYAQSLPHWQIATEASLIVGQVDGEAPYLLTRLAGATIRSDGSLAVADINSSEVRFYDSTGRFISRSGRKGRGPGEFTVMHDMVRTHGDTLVVWDETGGRITWIGPDRQTLRVEMRPGPRVFHVGALLGDGSRVLPVYPNLTEPTEAGVLWRPNGRVAFVDHRTGRIDTLGVFLGAEMKSGGMVPTPGRRDTRFATNGVAQFFAYGDNAAFDILLHKIVGPGTPARLTTRIRERFSPPRMNDRYLRGWREAMRQMFRGSVLEARAERELQSPALPETLPAFEDLTVDDLGFLWVEAFRADPQAPRSVTIFNDQGLPVARAQYPERLTVLEIGRDYVLGAFMDELDVVSVRKYQLTRQGAVR